MVMLFHNSKLKTEFNKKYKNYIPAKARNKGCNPKASIHNPIGIEHLNKRECERRKRQIARGQLKTENGLDISFVPQYIFK